MSLFTCRYCGQERGSAGACSVTGVGRCCAVCIEEMRQAKPLPKKQQAGAATIGDWPKRKAVCQPVAPAQRADGVTVCPAPAFHHRYGVDPASVPRLFSALKPGQYLEAV